MSQMSNKVIESLSGIRIEMSSLHDHGIVCLNMDDTGMCKTMNIGGHPRNYVSSQNIKWTIRKFDLYGELVKDDCKRTAVLPIIIADELIKNGVSRAKADEIAMNYICDVFGVKKNSEKEGGDDEEKRLKKMKTNSKLFLSEWEIDLLKTIIVENIDRITDLYDKNLKKADLTKELKIIFEESKKKFDQSVPQISVALFGRDAFTKTSVWEAYKKPGALAVQYAYTIGKAQTNMDLFVVGDDILSDIDKDEDSEEESAQTTSHIDFKNISSGCWFFHAVCDLGVLAESLNGDEEAIIKAIETVIPCFFFAQSRTNYRSTANMTPPSMAVTSLTRGVISSPAGAFTSGVISPKSGESQIQIGIDKFSDHMNSIIEMTSGYRKELGGGPFCSVLSDIDGENLFKIGMKCDGVEQQKDRVIEAVRNIIHSEG